jgi:hypothetical protein
MAQAMASKLIVVNKSASLQNLNAIRQAKATV